MSFDFDHAHKKREELAKSISGSFHVENLEKSEAHQDTVIGTPFDNQSRIALNISQSYSNAPVLLKAEEEELEKGGKKAFIGETRTHGGREYIRTANGWKFHGKGTGKKAAEHKAAAAGHTKEATTAAKAAPKSISFEEALADPEAKKHIEAIEYGSSDPEVIAHHKKELKEKHGYDYKSIDDVREKLAAEKKEVKPTSGKHIKDMSATEKKTLADKLGVDVKGKTTKQVDKALSDAMVDKQMADFKAKKVGKSEESTFDSQNKALKEASEDFKVQLKGYKYKEGSSSLNFNNPYNNSSISIDTYELGDKSVEYLVHCETKKEISSTSLADPSKAYLTTSARSVKHKKIKDQKFVTTLDQAKSLITKHLDKIK